MHKQLRRKGPLLIFDGECGFCRIGVEKWKTQTQDRIPAAASQEAGQDFPEIPKSVFQKSVVFIDEQGRWFEGALAVFQSLKGTATGKTALWFYKRSPFFRKTSEALYRLVAAHRRFFSKLLSFL